MDTYPSANDLAAIGQPDRLMAQAYAEYRQAPLDRSQKSGVTSFLRAPGPRTEHDEIPRVVEPTLQGRIVTSQHCGLHFHRAQVVVDDVDKAVVRVHKQGFHGVSSCPVKAR